MSQNSLLLPEVFAYAENVSDDSNLTSVTQLSNHPISVKNQINNWGFILFFVCFFIILNAINQKNKFLFSMFGRLFRNKERHSIFYETVANEFLNKFLLSFQTIVLISIILYCQTVHGSSVSDTSLTYLYQFLLKSFILLVAFFTYKFLTHSLLGIIFFKKETVLQWNDDFLSLISLNGIFLFFPVLILFYVEAAYTFCIYFIIFYFIFTLFFVFYKIYSLFFQGKQLLIYFILYLCTQEIIPLYLVYRGVIYLFEQKDTLWM